MKSYNSTLTVIDGGKSVVTKTISVNDPLVYKGIWFYQSSYGDAWDQIEVARVNIKDKETDKVLKTVDLEWQKEQAVADLDLKLSITDFVADFAFNSTEKKVFSKTVEHANPAIRLAVNERSTVQSTPWIFYQFPDLFDIKDSKYQFELVGYKPKKFTGLADCQESRDQYRLDRLDHDRGGHYSVVVYLPSSDLDEDHSGPEGVTVHLGGTTHKSQIDFQKEFRKLTEKIRTFSASPHEISWGLRSSSQTAVVLSMMLEARWPESIDGGRDDAIIVSVRYDVLAVSGRVGAVHRLSVRAPSGHGVGSGRASGGQLR